jgi:signal transduction histidine kinase/CheY-like chemotaxis protein
LFRRLNSIDWKFPLLLSGLVLATAVLFVGAAYSRFAGTLYDTSGQRLRTAAIMLSNMIGEGAPRRQAQMTGISHDSAVIDFLRFGTRRDEALAAIERSNNKPPEPGRYRVQLLATDGNERLSRTWNDSTPTPDWTQRQVRAHAVSNKPVSISPILDYGGAAQFQIVSPVFDDPNAKSGKKVVGYVVDTRRVVGRGQKAIQDLIGDSASLLIGGPGGSWTDLEKIVPGAPKIERADVPFTFDNSPRGAGIGVAEPVPGTPWLVWLQQPRTVVLAPVRQFVLRIIPTAGGIALIGAFLVWMFSRRITRRIVQLTEEVDRVQPIDAPSTSAAQPAADEIARLHSAFERMSDRVKTHGELEAQLRQSQKLEAVGRLAGGIAHDFNNILTVIRNYSELVKHELPSANGVSHDVDEIIRATERASGLTRQLLAFSRHQIVTPRVVDLNEVIASSEGMLRRLVPSNIEFVTKLDPQLGKVLADTGQIEQVILNLTINAADALPSGGRLSIHTQNTDLDGTFERGVGSFAGNGKELKGRHASIIVSDNGSGMDASTLARIFDPFFTTKEPGKGTGLGLSTVHGIVKQNDGRVWVYSEPGRGTTFKLYFPIVDADRETRPAPQRENGVFEKASGTVLLVEDDAATREVTRRVLSQAGYTVLEAGDGMEALETLRSSVARIDIVLTDLMMPRMSGAELSDHLASMRPDLPVLLMSGYADVEMTNGSRLDKSRPFLEKPFTAAALRSFVRDAFRVVV